MSDVNDLADRVKILRVKSPSFRKQLRRCSIIPIGVNSFPCHPRKLNDGRRQGSNEAGGL